MPATLRRPLPLFIASSKITSSVGADSISARRFPTNGHLLYTAGPSMPGLQCGCLLSTLSFLPESAPAKAFYALIHFTARKNCGILNKLLNSQQHAALPHAHKGYCHDPYCYRFRRRSDCGATVRPRIFVVPLSVTFADGTTQLDDGTMTKDEFSSAWRRTASCPLQASPARPALCRCMRMPPQRG